MQRRILRRASSSEEEAIQEADAELAEIVAATAREAEGGSWLDMLRQPTLAAVLVGVVLAVLQHAVGLLSKHSPQPHTTNTRTASRRREAERGRRVSEGGRSSRSSSTMISIRDDSSHTHASESR